MHTEAATPAREPELIAIVIDPQGVQRLPAVKGRPESGPMQFGDDWPGVFLRGDNAAYMAMMLQQHIEAATPLSKMVLTGFVQELQSCIVHKDIEHGQGKVSQP